MGYWLNGPDWWEHGPRVYHNVHGCVGFWGIVREQYMYYPEGYISRRGSFSRKPEAGFILYFNLKGRES